MSSSDSPWTPEEQSAIEFCLRLLREDPGTDYKEARREGRGEGLKVTRAIFSAAQRELEGSRPVRRPPHGRPPPDRREPAAPHAPRPPHRDQPSESAPRGRPAPAPPPHSRPIQPANSLVAPQRIRSEDAEAEAPLPTPETLFAPAPALTEPESARQTPVEFMVDQLKDNPETSFREMKELAEAKGFTIYPATFGRAQSLAGLLDDDSEESERSRAQRAQRARARPSSNDPATLLEDLVESFDGLASDRDGMRNAIASMLALVEKALQTPVTQAPEGMPDGKPGAPSSG